MNTSTGATITLDCNPQQETDAQSEAAKAAGRRREQNRLAQQKHRVYSTIHLIVLYCIVLYCCLFLTLSTGSKAREQNESQVQQQQRTRERKSTTPSREQAPPTPADTNQDSQSVHMSEDLTSEGMPSFEDPWAGQNMNLRMDHISGPPSQNFPGTNL